MESHEKKLIFTVFILIIAMILTTPIVFNIVKNKAKEIREKNNKELVQIEKEDVKIKESEIKIEPKSIVEISSAGAYGLYVRCNYGSIWLYYNGCWTKIKGDDK